MTLAHHIMAQLEEIDRLLANGARIRRQYRPPVAIALIVAGTALEIGND